MFHGDLEQSNRVIGRWLYRVSLLPVCTAEQSQFTLQFEVFTVCRVKCTSSSLQRAKRVVLCADVACRCSADRQRLPHIVQITGPSNIGLAD